MVSNLDITLDLQRADGLNGYLIILNKFSILPGLRKFGKEKEKGKISKEYSTIFVVHSLYVIYV